MSKNEKSARTPMTSYHLYVDGVYVGIIPAYTHKSALVQAKKRYGSNGVDVNLNPPKLEDRPALAQALVAAQLAKVA